MKAVINRPAVSISIIEAIRGFLPGFLSITERDQPGFGLPSAGADFS